MAKGGNNQRSNGSRFSKPYDTSNSFVKKVASRVSDYLGGWFGTPVKSTGDSMQTGGPPVSAGGDTPTSSSHGCLDALDTVRESTALTRQCFNDVDVIESPAKRIKTERKGKYNSDFPISPIPSTSSGLFSSNMNHNFNIQSSEDFLRSGPGPSGLQNQRYAASSTIIQSSTMPDVKANGATDDHSESSESTSGCSSLVPQSDRLSQSAYACTSRKKSLEDKLSYARQLKQSRASLLLNRSIPVGNEASGNRRKPSFDVSAYGSSMFDKSSVREKMVTSPFYTGQTSYGGASAYRRSRSSSLYSQRTLSSLDKREGLQLQVKPSHHGSTEDLSNMSHTAKRILEALEQFSTPINDVKRIPINAMNPPLVSKKRRLDDLSDSRVKLSTPKSPLNPNAGPSISGLNVPTVPDLLKLKRLERIQNSTAAARQVAVQNQDSNKEYSLPPVEAPPPKQRTGKIVTKLKDKSKPIPEEKPEEVKLPNVTLPITTLPKFDLQLPQPLIPPPPEKSDSNKFTFSPPIVMWTPPKSNLERSPNKNNFTFSNPLNAEKKENMVKDDKMPPLINFAEAAANAKLKYKSLFDNNVNKKFEIEPAKELKTGSVMDILKKSVGSGDSNNKKDDDNKKDTWECSSCLYRNLKDSKICVGCKSPKANENEKKTVSNASPGPSSITSPPPVEKKSSTEPKGWGDKFKPPSGSWTCKECFVTNPDPNSTKCMACETPKEKPAPKEKPTEAKPPEPVKNDWGDFLKKKQGDWSCPTCMCSNKESDNICPACQEPKPGAKVEKPEPPKFSFGIPPGAGGFKFGIDKADVKNDDKSNKDQSTPNGPKIDNPPAVTTPFGTFTFGVPKNVDEKKDTQEEAAPAKNSKPDSSMWNNAAWAKELAKEDSNNKKEEKNATFNVEKSAVETTTNNPPFKFLEENKDPKLDPPKFSSGSNLTNSVEVSSSTSNFTFGSIKPSTEVKSPFGILGAKTGTPKFEVKEVSSLPQIGSTTNFNSDLSNKVTFGSNSNTNSIFGSGIKPNNPIFGNVTTPATTTAASTTSSPFQMHTPVFTTGYFNGPNVSSVTTSFNAPVVTKAETTTTAFGSSTVPSTPFGATSTPFGSNNVSASTAFQTPAQPTSTNFFGTPSSTFGNSSFSSSNNSAFGTQFPSTSLPEKPAQSTPFVFGGNSGTTTAPAPVQTPGIFTFGAAKPEEKPFGAPLGQNGPQQQQQIQPFTFGAPSTNNVFGGFNAPAKTESQFGNTVSNFGNSAPINLGINSAPPAFGAAAPSFDFGASQIKPQFGFGTSNPTPQPASAPTTSFSLSVPPSFNFSGGQQPTFTADPTSVPPPSAHHTQQRRVIKAVRRTRT